MNYLAHLHIAEHTNTSLLGNFLGDFVKGNPDNQFNKTVVRGIRLHRFVDSYTDAHSLIKSVKPLFKPELRRFSPITLDMFWDHCLVQHWGRFHHVSLPAFCLHAEALIQQEKSMLNGVLPVRFESISQLVWQGKWFEHYADIHNIEFALKRIASRRTRMAPLADTFETLIKHYDRLNGVFLELYPDVLEAVTVEVKGGPSSLPLR